MFVRTRHDNCARYFGILRTRNKYDDELLPSHEPYRPDDVIRKNYHITCPIQRRRPYAL